MLAGFRLAHQGQFYRSLIGGAAFSGRRLVFHLPSCPKFLVRERRRIGRLGEGEIPLPAQSHYCFVLNHYNKEKGFENVLQIYRARTTKWYSEISSNAEPLFHKTYIPTADETSKDVTDYCLNHIAGVARIGIEFDADDGASFKHSISFTLK